MRAPFLLSAFVLGLVVAACADPEEEDLGSFPCGSEECDVRSEYCAVDDQCDGSQPATFQCATVPDECDGNASVPCLDMGGRFCSQGEEGGFSCSYACG